jgi:hypothetical protein
MALTQTEVSELYVAIFNRASEGKGNIYWQTNQPDMATTATAMLNTDDAKTYFGSSLDADQAFIEHIYKNTLNKTVTDDPDGISYWVNELASGKTRGEVVAALVTAIADYKDSTDATTKAAYDQFMNRVTVSNYTADHLQDAPSDYATSLNFGADLAVTNDASTVTSAESKVDNIVQTASAQLLTVSPDNLFGTNGDDLFDGSVVQNQINGTNVDTFTSSDRVDGGTGNDTLIIQNMGNNVSGAVSNIENIKFTAFGAVTYDMSNTTGVTDFLNQNSVANLTVTGANEMNVGVKNVNGKATDITFDGTVYATTTDSTTLTLENVTNQAVVTLDSKDNSNNIETLNIVSKTAANKIDLGGTAIDGTTKIVISGDKDLSIDTTDGTTAMAALKTVDASAFTGALDLDLRNNGADVKLNITGGTGDDKLMIDNFTKDDVIDLGDGEDALGIDLNADVTTAASLKNIEKIALRTTADRIVNLDGATELTELAVENGGQTIRVTKAAASVKTLDFLNLNTKTSTTVDDLNFALKDSSGTDDSLTLNFASVDSDGRAVQMNDTATLTMTNFIANGIENITINTANLGKDDATTTAIEGGLDISTSFSTDSLTNLTIVSDTYVDIGVALDDNISVIDASATTSGVVLDLTNVQNAGQTTIASQVLTVTTGSGADTLNSIFAGTTAVQTSTFTLGAGNDTLHITGKADNDTTNTNTGSKVTIDAGAGNDTIDISGSDTLAAEATFSVTLGDGVDTIKILGTKSQTGVTVKDFVAGSGGDKIDLLTNSSTGTVNTMALVDTDTTSASAATYDNLLNDGLDIVIGTNANSLSTTDVATALSGFTATASNTSYIVISDGSDAGLYEFINTAADTAVAAGELTLLTTLTGIDNTSTLNADNFADFL